MLYTLGLYGLGFVLVWGMLSEANGFEPFEKPAES
jgi:hypothetical protein